jgi:hypothetical protein
LSSSPVSDEEDAGMIERNEEAEYTAARAALAKSSFAKKPVAEANRLVEVSARTTANTNCTVHPLFEVTTTDDRNERPTVPAPASEAERAFEEAMRAYRGRWGAPKDLKLPLRERLEANSCPEPNTGCILWIPKSSHELGYGHFPDGAGGTKYAHRASLELHLGRRLQGAEFACHRCDTPACINPEHLFVGSTAANTADMVSKRRHPHGARHGMAKLSSEDVRAIRAAAANGESRREIAARYAVTYENVWLIVTGRSWKYEEPSERGAA